MGLRRVCFSAEPERVAAERAERGEGRGAKDREGPRVIGPIGVELLQQRRHALVRGALRCELLGKKKQRAQEGGRKHES